MYDIDMLEGALRSKVRRIDALESQRDQLREALTDALCCLEVCGKDYDYAIGKARDALKATEEGG